MARTVHSTEAQLAAVEVEGEAATSAGERSEVYMRLGVGVDLFCAYQRRDTAVHMDTRTISKHAQANVWGMVHARMPGIGLTVNLQEAWPADTSIREVC